MRVLQMMAGGEAGGAETHFVEAVLALHRAGIQQLVVTRAHAVRVGRLRSAGIGVVTARFGRWLDFGTSAAVAAAMRTFRPDLVQAWMGRAASFLPRGDIPRIGWFGGYYDLKRFRSCRWLVGCTPDIAGDLVRRGAPADRTLWIPVLAEPDPGPAIARATLATPDDAPLVLFLGRLHEKKGVDTLLRALARLDGVHAWIAGEGPLAGDLRALAGQLGLDARVRFLGWREDRGALLRAADVLAVPSRYEPFGAVMIEAWASRVPLVAAAAQGPKAFVAHETNGLLVPIDDVAALAGALGRALGEPGLSQRLVAGGAATYAAGFAPESVAASWRRFYETVLATRP